MTVLQTWTFAPVPVALAIVAAVFYLWGVRRVRVSGHRWPWWRTVLFVGVGLPLLVLTVTWWPGARSHELFSAYMTQLVMLALIVPAILVFGAPARLWRDATQSSLESGRSHRVLDSKPLWFVTHPLLTPLIMLALPVAIVFTPMLLLSLENEAAYIGMQLVLVVVGLVALLGLVEGQVPDHRIPYAAAAFIAFFELILDAIPGGILFFTTTLMAGGWYATHGDPGGTPWAESDQHAAGAILWAVGEGIDLPFLIIIVVLWMRADAEEARRVDALLDAQDEAARRAEAYLNPEEPDDLARP